MAGKFLEEKGYRILEKNFRCLVGEMDLIAKDKQEIVFVEVKMRTSTFFGYPEEAVNPYKQRRLQKIAEIWLKKNKMEDEPYRIDVVSIIYNEKTREEKIEHFVNAIEAC